ncbi:right-handed parallel beta-helix repeat-containing protein [Salibacter halophilus]|uniref:Right handed beta helix domain-containing protein n=1 Tax=Salibacter halophilus TaxID=1803916 RepID=A0A6N6M3H0_9FLAO|nr:right-handed parallel beta-helix repeat-containing protein [Salibacter halophilus]KAB1063695.1 hypothetical protein F3059_09000 [Salibacter halophilus]
MKKASIAIAGISLFVMGGISSCKKDDDDNSNQQPVAQTVTLDCSTISEPKTLKDLGSGVDYIVPCYIDVEASLTIQPGVTIEFKQDAGFEINDYSDAEGAIQAEGTKSKPIRFTGSIKEKGAWEGIIMYSEDLRNKMNYCIIEYAGGQDNSGQAIWMDNETKLELKNSVIRKNKGHGMYIKSTSNIEGFANNKFTENTDYPLNIAARQVTHLDGDNSEYEGNLNGDGDSMDEIYVFSKSIYNRGRVIGSSVHEWHDPGVPFYVNELVYVGETQEGALQIHEGCTLRFGQNYGFWVDEYNASFEVLGTSDNKVVMEGREGKGSWNGVYINTNNVNNKIENAIIRDGGQAKAGHWHDNPANLSLGYYGDEVQLTLKNVEINNSAGCGISETGDVSLTTSNVTYSGNSGADICN